MCVLLAFSWQALKVRSEFGGNWTGLFDTGKAFPPPPELARENILVVSETTGYDGQFYHYVAHDPFLRRGLTRYVDNPRLRYSRILVPMMAYLLSAGHQDWVDRSFRLVILLFVGLGAWWMTRFALKHRWRKDSALLFVLFPAAILSVETLTVDVALMALCVGFLLFQDEQEPAWKLAAILVLAPLVRETGAILTAAATLSALRTRRWRRALLFAGTIAPWLAWISFLYLHTDSHPYAISPIPFSETWLALLHVRSAVQGPIGSLLTALDRLAILGSALAIVLGLFQIRRPDAVALACAGFGVLGLLLQRGDVWLNYHAHTRVLSPLYLWLAMESTPLPPLLARLPLILVTPRYLLQVLPQLPLFIRSVRPNM